MRLLALIGIVSVLLGARDGGAQSPIRLAAPAPVRDGFGHTVAMLGGEWSSRRRPAVAAAATAASRSHSIPAPGHERALLGQRLRAVRRAHEFDYEL